MTIHSLELNDTAVSLYADTHMLVKSPGFAVRDGNQIFMGGEAQHRARLLPRHLNHWFWSQLNLETMGQPLGQWHRHADIAHAHLLAISDQADNPDEIVLAVPGHYHSDQLALLLGMARECSFKAVGLVDSALASSFLIEPMMGSLVHLDMQLHQALVTQFTLEGETLKRTAVVPIPGMGLQKLYDTWARFIAEECIRQTRFDPMHKAESEQALYNQLPSWLDLLQCETEINVELQGYPVRLNQKQLIQCVDAIYKKLISVQKDKTDTVILTHRVASLPGLALQFTQPVRLNEDAVAQGIIQCIHQIRGDRPDLEFITRLTRPKQSQQVAKTKPVAQSAPLEKPLVSVTHVLWRNKAYALHFNVDEADADSECRFLIGTNIPNNKFSLCVEDDGVDKFSCRVCSKEGHLWLNIDKNSESFFTLYQLASQKNDNGALQCGDTIRLAGSREELTFIQVID